MLGVIQGLLECSRVVWAAPELLVLVGLWGPGGKSKEKACRTEARTLQLPFIGILPVTTMAILLVGSCYTGLCNICKEPTEMMVWYLKVRSLLDVVRSELRADGGCRHAGP